MSRSYIRISFYCALACLAASAYADTYTEILDAGQLPASAQAVDTSPGGTALTAILGTLSGSPGDAADMFQIYLTGGQTFSATTVSNTTNFFDTELFLFDSSGKGVYANDDDPANAPQSTLPSGISLTPSASGVYYLAIAGECYLPVSGGGSIFPVCGTLGAVGPTGPGGASAVTGWMTATSESGDYEIGLTGAQFLPSSNTNVPEASSIAFVTLGAFALGALRRVRVSIVESRNQSPTNFTTDRAANVQRLRDSI